MNTCTDASFRFAPVVLEAHEGARNGALRGAEWTAGRALGSHVPPPPRGRGVENRAAH